MLSLIVLAVTVTFKLCWWCIYYGAILMFWVCKALFYLAVILCRVVAIGVVALVALITALVHAIQRQRTV